MKPGDTENTNGFLAGYNPEGPSFEVPEGYFDTLHRSILSKTAKNGFEVPEGYFDQLPGKIRESVLVKSKPQKRIIPLFSPNFRIVATGIAAVLIVTAGVYLFRLQQANVAPGTAMNMQNLTEEEIVNYVDVSDITDQHLSAEGQDPLQKQVEEFLIESADEQLIIEEL